MDSDLDIKEEPVWHEEHFETVTVAAPPEADTKEVLDVTFKQEFTAEVLVPKVEVEEEEKEVTTEVFLPKVEEEEEEKEVTTEVLLPKVEEEEEESPLSSIQNVKEAAHSEKRDVSRVLVKDIHPSAIESEVTSAYSRENGALGKSFLRSEDLQKLMSTHSRVMWCCHFCGKRFENEQLLKKHAVGHNKKKGVSLLIQSVTDSYSTAENEKRLYCCYLCGISSFHHEDIINHIKNHAVVKQYKCEMCPKSFQHPSNLKRHLQIHDTGRQRQHPCSICNKLFTRLDSLKRHELWHTSGRRYSCTLCGKSFSQSGNLKKHIAKHSGAKNYTCSVCGKAYTERSTLKTHQVVHSDNQKPYSCDICGKSFGQKSHLKAHTRRHAGLKPYSCCICDKKFATRRNMVRHVLSHSKNN